jgi:hypothetical protein
MALAAAHLGRFGRTPCARKRFALTATIAMMGLSLMRLPAQSNVTSSAGKSSNRFLFIVETSHAMRPRARGVFDAMKQALDSSLKGQIHQGDLVGIWTFNESVYQGLFPSQEWSQPTQLAFAVRLPTLADPETYLKRARLDKVIPEMLKVISESENVTIIFVSAGEGVMQGTPFSAQINSAWKEWHDEQDGVHMPLLTVLRTRQGQHMDWLLTPAPRPIELTALAADSKPADEKDANPRAVILESGLVTKKSEPPALAPEQQVAFSFWALGNTGLVTAAKSPQTNSMSKVENSASPAIASSPVASREQVSSVPSQGNDTSKLVAAVFPMQDQPVSAPAAPRTANVQEDRVSTEIPVSTTISNTPSRDVGKPVEVVFVTNETPHPAVQPPVNTIRSVETPSVELTTQPAQDIPRSEQLLAHARAANPEEEKRAPGFAAAPQRSFLRENINPLTLMMAAAFGAAYSFRMWFLTHARATGNAMSLTQANKGE